MIDSGSRGPGLNWADPKSPSKLYDFTDNTGHNLVIEAVSTGFGKLYGGSAFVDAGSGNASIDPTNYRARFGQSAST